MLFTRYTAIIVLLTIFVCQSPVWGQQGIDLDIKKPPEYDNRVLRSEKSDRKKFRIPSRIVQNTTTHYNFYFNANNKLNEVIEKAKLSYKDDYSKLLSFYNYSLDATAADTILLDSVSYKAQTGIVLHDLRGDWIDNMYLLWGISYYLKKQHDSAYLMFQFLNYAFAEKESDGYYKTIGSNMDGNSAFTVSSKENKSLPRKIFYHQPSRNDAFIWQIRNFIVQGKYVQAASLISILKNDPRFPGRLRNDLEETQALFFYDQKMWDSAAVHLSNALDNAPTKLERARWEYLAGQLYEMSGKYEEAEGSYAKAIQHTVDPVLEIYARLASVRVNKSDNSDYIKENIATLVKMAKRDKYIDYRDIIYFMAAQMELEQSNSDGAIAMLQKSVAQVANNPSQRNKAFLQLAELLFTKRLYRQSYNFYDSLRLDDPDLKDPEAITKRKNVLQRLAANVEIIERQDSIQKIAALPEDERKSLVRKLVRQLRRQQGLKDEGVVSASSARQPQQPAPVSLFDDNKKGEWYFYNSNSRQKGQADFKAKWGNRSNTDNWRRSAAVIATVRQQQVTNINDQMKADVDAARTASGTQEITFDALYEKLPLSQLKMAQSDDSINVGMYALGLIYIQELEDCVAGTEVLEKLKLRSPDHLKMDEILFNLYYCRTQKGVSESLLSLKKEMNEKFPNSNFTTIVNTGKNPKAEGQLEEPTKAYEKIYDLFIEGNFSEAIAQKKLADSMYSNNFWTPQLLYIESVYYVKQNEDSTAKIVLNNIIKKFPGTALAEKAATMIDVLGRRKEIEEELRNMVINMPPPDTTRRYQGNNVAIKDIKAVDTIPKQPDIAVRQPIRDTIVSKPVNPPVAINNKPADTVQQKPPIVQPPPPAFGFTFEADKPHYVLLMMNKVDPIFVSEARNAFYRYNRSTYYNKQMNAELVQIDNDNHLLLVSPFKTMQEAVDYIDKTKPKTATEIIPWLKGGKYSYSIITEKNLETLKNTKEIDKYSQFLEQHLPGKF